MWGKAKRGLAIVLACALSLGDFLPAMAAAPEMITNGTEGYEEQEKDIKEPDAQEPTEDTIEAEEQPDLEEPAETKEVTAELEEQAVTSDTYTDKGTLDSWSGTITIPAGGGMEIQL